MVEIEHLNDLRLGLAQKGSKLWEIDTEFAIVVFSLPKKPTSSTVTRPNKTDALPGGGFSTYGCPVIASTMRSSRPRSLVSGAHKEPLIKYPSSIKDSSTC